MSARRVADVTDMLLHKACAEGREARVRRLLKAGADATEADDNGWTPLHRACVGNHKACARMLLEAGGDADAPDLWGYTPLHVACEHGHAEMAELLLEACADPGSVNANGMSPLDCATRFYVACGDGERLVDLLVREDERAFLI